MTNHKTGAQKKNPTVTRDQVAKAAGVSSATVSRVYNSPELVAEEKILAVRETALKLGYIPNKAASALRRNGTGNIIFLEIRKKKRPYYWGNFPAFNWFYGDIIKGIKQALDDTMYHLVLETVKDFSELEQLPTLCDGLICYDIDTLEEAQKIKALGIPYIIAHHTEPFSRYARCSTDNMYGGRLQAQHLYNLHAKHPLYITGHLDLVPPHKARLNGFMDFWEAHENTKPKVFECEIGRNGGYQAAVGVAELLKNEPIDSIAAVNDLTLSGLLAGLYNSDCFSIDTLPVVGYDALPIETYGRNSIASIDLQPGKIYKRATEMLLQQIRQDSFRGEFPYSLHDEISDTILPVLRDISREY